MSSKAAQPDVADEAKKGFKGIGVVLVVDAVAGTAMEGMVIHDDRGFLRHRFTSPQDQGARRRLHTEYSACDMRSDVANANTGHERVRYMT